MSDETVTAIPLPVDLDEYEENRAAIEELGDSEHATAPDLLLPTIADAQRAAARVACLRGKVAELTALYDEEEKALLSQLDALRQRKADAVKPFERRMSWYLYALEQFHRARLQADPKEKTIRLPAGDMTMRAQQPEWVFGNESLTVEELRYGRPDLIRVKEEIDKAALKKAATIEGSYAYIVTKDGEKRQLPVQIVERPPKFEFKTVRGE